MQPACGFSLKKINIFIKFFLFEIIATEMEMFGNLVTDVEKDQHE